MAEPLIVADTGPLISFSHIDALHALASLYTEVMDDLAVPPNNKLEALKGDRKGQHSIRVNDQWRLCFVWSGSDAEQVEIVDYH